MFVDNVEIWIKTGNGGRGSASFRKEKFLPFGGPDGGDGGKGGDIYFLADSNIEDLRSFKHRVQFNAGKGGNGGPQKMHGLNAEDLVIKVPAGTAVYMKEDEKEQLIADLSKNGQKVLAAKGGKGGKGNVHFATATRKAPTIFQPGEEGIKCKIILRMRLFVEVCILGFPNSGKSSLLSMISAARPEIADYPYTTTQPVLGSVDDGQKKYTWAEIPAITEGSNAGKGLGSRFIAHAERAKVLIYLLDAGRKDLEEDYQNIMEEIHKFDLKLAGKKLAVAINKIDILEDKNILYQFRDKLTELGITTYLISAKEKMGLIELVAGVHKMVQEEEDVTLEDLQPKKIFRPKPVKR